MAPLLILLGVSALAFVVGLLGVEYTGTPSAAIAVGLATMFLITGATHFLKERRAGLIAIVPPSFPRPELLVTVTGVLECLGAIGLLVPGTRTIAAVCLALLLVAMFPANVYAAGGKRHEAAPHTPLVRRTVIQFVFVAACVVVALGY